jgi:hypothetical protein
MSADNWTVCPVCFRNAVRKRSEAIVSARKSYGKVTAEKFIDRLAAAEALAEEPEASLREDYELGTNQDGEFSVSYACSCRECGFQYQFKDTQLVFE